MRLALHCGVPHYELLWSLLDTRQMREIEIYSGLEPIAWDVAVSEPPQAKSGPRPAVDVEAKLDRILGSF